MKYLPLGQSGIVVSRICFGTLTIGPLQANLPLEQGVLLLEEAVERGINFSIQLSPTIIILYSASSSS